MLKGLLTRSFCLYRADEKQEPSGVEGLRSAVALFEQDHFDLHRCRLCEAGGCMRTLEAACRTMWRECGRA